MAKRVIKESELTVVDNKAEEEVIDIDLSATAKKRFRIDGDNNRILYLNTSDMGMVARLDKAQKDLADIQKTIYELQDKANDDESEDYYSVFGDKFKEADDKMRVLVDYIFDAPVSHICAPDGSMYDPFEGKFRFEHIIDRLIPLYEANIAKEAKSLSVKSQQYTKKYTKKK